MTEPEVVVDVAPDGGVSYVYSDALPPGRLGLGTATIRRASHVEPDGEGRWWADLSPSGGPRLGPFDLRRDALAAELAWLRREKVGSGA